MPARNSPFRSLLSAATVTVLVLSVVSCGIMTVSADGTTPIVLNAPLGEYEVLEHFEISKAIWFEYGAPEPDLPELLSEVVARTGADALINVRIHARTSPAHFLAGLFTLGLVSGYQIDIEGDAVRQMGREAGGWGPQELAHLARELRARLKVQLEG